MEVVRKCGATHEMSMVKLVWRLLFCTIVFSLITFLLLSSVIYNNNQRNVLCNNQSNIIKKNPTSRRKNHPSVPTKAQQKKQNFDPKFDARLCTSPHINQSAISAPFKIYIYNLPSKFNKDILRTLQRKESSCYSFQYCGFGARLFSIEDDVWVYDSNQFSLEVIIHHLLQSSPYRTLNPDLADIFYIPAYIGLECLINYGDHLKTTQTLIKDLFSYLQNSTYFITGKPHFSTLGKIEKEMTSTSTCPYLFHPKTKNITYLSIEKEVFYIDPRAGKHHVLSVPYPSYIHFTRKSGIFRNIPNLFQRDVFMLLAAGAHRQTPYRNQVMDQFKTKTTLSYSRYLNSRKDNSNLNMIMFITSECSLNGKQHTIPWMLHSTFCLQPPGDSPTRKSFYDSILSGCIPVLFPYPNHQSTWAFQNHFNFTDFTVTIPYSLMQAKLNIFNFLKAIPSRHILRLHERVMEVRKWFQYTLPDGNVADNQFQDAMFFIYKDLAEFYKLNRQLLL